MGWFVVSCSTDNSPLINSGELGIGDLLQYVSEHSSENRINIAASNVHGITSQIDIHKELAVSLRKEGYQNTVAIDQKEIDFEQDSYVKVYSSSADGMDDMMPKFGANIIVSIKTYDKTKESEVAYRKAEVYNPAMIKATNMEEIMNIDKTQDLTIRWNPDPVNDKPISITLISRKSGDKNVHINKVVNDTGAFTITASELSIFSAESKIDVLLARGNTETNGDTEINLYNVELISSEVQ